MSLFDPSPTAVIAPGQLNGAGAVNATLIEEYTGEVERVFKRKCLAMKMAKIKTVRGTDTITKRSAGLSEVNALVIGDAPAGTTHKFGRNRLSVEVPVFSREHINQFQEFQSDFDVRAELAAAQAEAHARLFDQSYFIALMKAAKATTSPYGTTDNFFGGSQETIGLADSADATKLYNKVADLLAKMAEKDALGLENLAIYTSPAIKYRLLKSDLVINGEYKTASGTSLGQVPIFSAFGIPVLDTNNAPFGQTITGHLLSTTANGNFFDGDFSDDLLVIGSPGAVFAGQTAPISSKIWFSDAHFGHIADTTAMYSMGIDRPEYAGILSISGA